MIITALKRAAEEKKPDDSVIDVLDTHIWVEKGTPFTRADTRALIKTRLTLTTIRRKFPYAV